MHVIRSLLHRGRRRWNRTSPNNVFYRFNCATHERFYGSNYVIIRHWNVSGVLQLPRSRCFSEQEYHHNKYKGPQNCADNNLSSPVQKKQVTSVLLNISEWDNYIQRNSTMLKMKVWRSASGAFERRQSVIKNITIEVIFQTVDRNPH